MLIYLAMYTNTRGKSNSKPSLITPHSIFITHYLSLITRHSSLITYHLKYPNFLNPTRLAHCFQLLITKKFVLFVGLTA